MLTATKTLADPVVLAQIDQAFQRVQQTFKDKHKVAAAWLEANKIPLDNLKLGSQQFLAATALASSMVMKQTVDAQVAEQLVAQESKPEDSLLTRISVEEHQAIIDKMKSLVRQAPGHLQREDELYLEQQLSDMLGFVVTAELDDHRLNHSVGIMGGEQHLRRFPTDTLEQHDAYQESGIAPNRGAFGWFTENNQLTDEAIRREKYYFAVQTLYLPNWNTDHADLKPWYKFRKMIAINPADEVAVVGVVGDAGPALWVQKQFGGSPEVIREAKIWSKEARGRVFLFFVDDPENKIPLGPMDLKAATLLAHGSVNE